MSKLTKAQAKAHEQACALCEKDHLSFDERWFVLENWREDACHINSAAGAFFTPPGLARDFAIEVSGRRVLDLCAGIGALSFILALRADEWGPPVEIVCIETNQDYIDIGRKLVPEATWICADVFDLPEVGRFDCVISNPPFGATKRKGSAPRYTGKAFEYHVIDIASDLADYGVFIVPQMSAPFRYSGEGHYREERGDEYEKFQSLTGIELLPNCGIDTSFYRDQWRGTAPSTEIVIADFKEARAARRESPAQPDLFGEAA